MLSWVSIVIAGISGTVAVIRLWMAVIRLWLMLSFLRHVFDRAGDRKDLEAAGKAISPHWTVITAAWRHQASIEEREPGPRPAA